MMIISSSSSSILTSSRNTICVVEDFQMSGEKRIAVKTTKGGPKRSNLEATDDRWKFLEEIDAPMWVDLEAEDQCMEQVSDHAWFQVIHPLHQRSSHQILSSFHVVGTRNEDRFDFLSPKLPDSVSGSRGKHYKKQSWAEVTGITSRTQKLSADSELFQHPVKALGSNKSFSSNSGNSHSSSTGALTTKTPSNGSKSSPVALKMTLDYQADYVEKSCQKPVASRMSQPFPRSSGLLSVVRVCLRRSFLTGHASRVEVKDDENFKGRKSSSNKSSIGSSTNIRGTSTGVDSRTISKKERTPQSRLVSSASTIANGTRKIRMVSGMTKTWSSNQNPSSKAMVGTIRNSKIMNSRKPLQPLNIKAAPKDRTPVNPKQSTYIRKTQVAASFRTGKENAPKSSAHSTKDRTCSVQLRDRRLTVVKGKSKESAPMIQGKNQKAANQNMHLR